MIIMFLGVLVIINFQFDSDGIMISLCDLFRLGQFAGLSGVRGKGVPLERHA